MKEKYLHISYIIMFLALFMILKFNFLSLMFSTILTYIFINKTNNFILFSKNKINKDNKYLNINNINYISVIFIISIVSLAITGLCIFIYHFFNGDNFNLMLNKMITILEETRTNKSIPTFITNNIPDNVIELKKQLAQIIKNYLKEITSISKNSITNFIYIIIGIIIGVMLSFHKIKIIKNNAKEEITLFQKEVLNRINIFRNSFEDVFLAQVKISLVDTILTAIYIYIALPLFDIHLPFKFTILIVAFIVGLIPVIGNLISNTIIIVLSLGISIYVAITSLIFLVVIHKLEYFLNAKIIGNQIQATAWELLLVMVIFEPIFGIGGIIVAPIYYAYFKNELRKQQLIK